MRDERERKIISHEGTKTQRREMKQKIRRLFTPEPLWHEGGRCFVFLVSWCLCGENILRIIAD